MVAAVAVFVVTFTVLMSFALEPDRPWRSPFKYYKLLVP